MKHLKRHGVHIAMCAPMILVAGILLASGSGVAILIPLAGCMLMMAMMMNAMGQGGGQSGSGR